MLKIIILIQVVVGVLLSLLILIQPKGTGLSIAPGSADFGKFEKRGPEKTLHIVTIILGAVFVLNATVYFFLA